MRLCVSPVTVPAGVEPLTSIADNHPLPPIFGVNQHRDPVATTAWIRYPILLQDAQTVDWMVIDRRLA